MNNIENNICQAIDIIVKRAISQAEYDRTIQATVIKCIDQTIGKYSVRYQDSTFYAYSSSSDASYSDGTAVYVLVPAGNMSKDKTIIGAVKNLGANFITSTKEIDKYNIVGNNNIDNHNETFGLKSYYPGGMVTMLYSKDGEDNKIDVDEAAFVQCLQGASNIICGATFKTALPQEQQYNGNYGLLIAIDYRGSSPSDVVTREYVIDINRMEGNPYQLVNDTRQTAIFNIDVENYICINYISIFSYGFPHYKEESLCDVDIWVKDIELYAAERLSEDALTGYTLTFTAPRGVCFNDAHAAEDELVIQAQVRARGQVVDTATQSIDFYWFVENAVVDNLHRSYNQYGGGGWQCLNEYDLVESEDPEGDPAVQWVPAEDTWTVAKKEMLGAQTVYKCVAVYNGMAIGNTITLTLLNSGWNAAIESSQGSVFYFGGGKTTLTCKVNDDPDPRSYTYCWARVNQDDYFETLTDTTYDNEQYAAIVKEYEDLKQAIANEEVLASESAGRLNDLENQIKAYDNKMRVDKNVVYNVAGSSIDRTTTFKCSVFIGDTLLGTASITLVNQLTSEGTWYVVIKNGSQVFKYSEHGVSPAEKSNLNPVIIEPLAFDLYDNLGSKIDSALIDAADVSWTVPIEDTLLKMVLDEEGDYVDNEDGTRTYSGLKEFPYAIASTYDVDKQRNDIRLEVKYRGMWLTDVTKLVFTKQGESGTNGTEYVCRIVPNCAGAAPKTPQVTMDETTGSVSWNFDLASRDYPFRVELWHNDNLIFNAIESGPTLEGNDATIAWSMLQNRYTYTDSDESSFSIDEATGQLTVVDIEAKDPANIVKVQVQYNHVTYYATLPIITAVVKSGYEVSLKEDTGFNRVTYSSDGKRPKYDDSAPFEVIVTEQIGKWTEDISTKTGEYAVDYTWRIIGTIKEGYPTQIVDVPGLIEVSYRDDELARNQKIFRAVDDYEGQCVNNAVACTVSRDGEVLAVLHIPIHFMLDRYGNSALNGWDGNSISLSEDGGFILAPQVGAGIKESDNSFTGILMGKVKEGMNSEEIGLFGYYKGQRSIFLDAETGIAKFGLERTGQIIIDPSDNTACLYSGNYMEGSSGMLIDLTTPEIRYGNGNFSVDANGQLLAQHATVKSGFIGDGSNGWTINADSITNGKTEINDNTHQGIYLGTKQIAFGSNSGYSYFNSDGTFNLANSNIKFDGSTLSFGPNVKLSWGQITGTGNVASKSDIPSDAYITQITKNTVTTAYVNALNVKAGSVAAENITGTTISGKTISGGLISGAQLSGMTGSIGGFTIESNRFEGSNLTIYSNTGFMAEGIGSRAYLVITNGEDKAIYGADEIDLCDGIWMTANNGVGSIFVGARQGEGMMRSDIMMTGGTITALTVIGRTNLQEGSTLLKDKYALKTELSSYATQTWVSTNFIQSYSNPTFRSIELMGNTTPFIDFHYGSNASDYTFRIAEYSQGQISLEGTYGVVVPYGGLTIGNTALLYSEQDGLYIRTGASSFNYIGFVAGAMNGAVVCQDGGNRSPLGTAAGIYAVSYIGTHPTSFAVNGRWEGSGWQSRTITMTSSDIRLKENIKDTQEEALPMINKIRMRQFDWNTTYEHQKLGFVADELEKLDPKFAVGGGYDADGCMNVKSVDTFYMLGYVVKAIQELSYKLQQKESEIAYLKAQLEQIGGNTYAERS